MSKKKQSKSGGLLGRIIRRFFLLLFTLIVLLVVGLALMMNLVFNGPSPAARDVLTMSLLEPSATKWIPGLFMDEAGSPQCGCRQGSCPIRGFRCRKWKNRPPVFPAAVSRH